jgi:hypothetical protein
MDFKSARLEGPKGEVFVTPSERAIFSKGRGFSGWDNVTIAPLVRISEIPPEVAQEVQQRGDLDPLAPFISENPPGVFEFVNGAQGHLCEHEDGSLFYEPVGTESSTERLRETYSPQEAQFPPQAISGEAA